VQNGTKLLLNTGELKNIEKINLGDSVIIFNIEDSVLEKGKISTCNI